MMTFFKSVSHNICVAKFRPMINISWIITYKLVCRKNKEDKKKIEEEKKKIEEEKEEDRRRTSMIS